MNSFYSLEELRKIPFLSVGKNPLISRNAQFYSPEKIRLGDHVRIDDFCILSGGEGIAIGSYVHIAAYCALYGNLEITIGDFAGLSSRVSIYTYSDDYSGAGLTNPTVPAQFRTKGAAAPISIGRHAIIGTNSTLLPGSGVGEGGALGAHSLLTKRVPPWTIFFGNPAKLLKKRKKNLLQLEKQLLEKEPTRH